MTKVWKLLIDKKLNKTQMWLATGISFSTLAKLSKEGTVTLEVLEKICDELHCNIGDIVEFVKK